MIGLLQKGHKLFCFLHLIKHSSQTTFLQLQLKNDNSFLFPKQIEQLICCMFVIFLLQFKHMPSLTHFFFTFKTYKASTA